MGILERSDYEKSKYKFNILPWEFKAKILFLGYKHALLKNKTNSQYINLEKVFKEAAFFIDISGYALSSQWSLTENISYLLNIATAKFYSIPYYIFPQSIGPFNYSVTNKFLLYPLLKVFLKYPEKIFVREREGFSSVRRFSKNVTKSFDLVLQNKSYSINNFIFGDLPLKNIEIKPNSVGIIPNLRVLERANSNEIFNIYVQLISKLINDKKNVYLLRHSYDDLEVCLKIKNFFQDNEKIKVVSEDLNVFELEKIIKNFDFVIAY